MKIAGRDIGVEHKPYVIAEMSANHNGNIETAFKTIELAKNAGADAVKIVCTGVFTADAVDFARGKPIELINGAPLLELVRQVQAGPPANTVSGLRPTAVSPVRVEPTADPRCQRCGSAMARRTNRSTGSPFWGCVAYPRCKGTAPA